MLDALMQASPSAGAWKREPMSVAEIDAHPDADRIWATISAIRGEVDQARQDGFEEGAADVEAAVEDEFSRCEEMLDNWTDRFLEDAEDMTAQEIRDALIATDWAEVLK